MTKAFISIEIITRTIFMPVLSIWKVIINLIFQTEILFFMVIIWQMALCLLICINLKIPTFFSKHKTFKVYTPKSIKTYKVYSAYEYDDRHINNSFDHFTDDKVFKEYIDYSLNPTNAIVSNVRKGTKVTINDKLITLSTCTNNRPENRFLVQGVLIKNERTE